MATEFEALRAARIIATALLVAASGANAATVDFEVPTGSNAYTSLYWAPIDGFQFNPHWTTGMGADTRNAPYINATAGAIASTFGLFTFDSLTISAWPWDGFDLGRQYNDLPLSFFDEYTNLLARRTIDLGPGGEFVTFSERIEGVHAIMIGSGGVVAHGVRLGSVTFNEPVVAIPVPASSLLVGTALALLVGSRRNARLKG